ncbi:DUF4738 domain-containing protein [Bacteroides sp. 224]|uniref:DUF4738 domain-containing protein n=1 Tax=Bacteroides sp. 224 TaxID=2302936 RepID=UPI0013D811E6|nr:DUF4738 domain-containing protein [Bacteroides sp. 224]NDV65129.1 DUF4738 domain-containing protein [Bacteroides sp. 224]
MKKLLYLFIVSGLITVAACSKKDNSQKVDDTRVLMQNTTDKEGLQRMQVSKNEQTVTFKGKEYNISILRTPDDSLTRVKSEMGDVFIDNRIALRITQGNREVLNKSFTKHSFSSVVNANFMKKSILEGMVFDKTTTQGIIFAVSVSYPQTDLYIPISLTVDADGKMSMKREELIEEIYQPEE